MLLIPIPQVAEGHFSSSEFTHGGCGGGNSHRDPVNFILYDTRDSTTNTAVNHVAHHTGWTNTSGSSQNFYTHGYCRTMENQRASAQGTRFHIRFFAPYDPDNKGRWETVGSAHHEDLTYCGHAVDKNGREGSGFDQGRNRVIDAFRGHHYYGDYVAWGNTRNMKQCDGDWAGSDGNVAWFRITNPTKAASTSSSTAVAPPDPNDLIDTAEETVYGQFEQKLLDCTTDEEPPNFGNYYLGSEFEGLWLNAVVRRCDNPDVSGAGSVALPTPALRANYVSYIYGDCSAAGDQPCAPPVEVQSWPICERYLSWYRLEPEGVGYPYSSLTIRGVPAASFDGGTRLELYTGDSTVVLFGGDAAQVRRAADGLLQTNRLPSISALQAGATMAEVNAPELPTVARQTAGSTSRC